MHKSHTTTFQMGLCTSVMHPCFSGVVYNSHVYPFQRGLHATPVQSSFQRGCAKPHATPCKSPLRGDCVQSPCNCYLIRVATPVQPLLESFLHNLQTTPLAEVFACNRYAASFQRELHVSPNKPPFIPVGQSPFEFFETFVFR